MSQMIEKMLDDTSANLYKLDRKKNNYLWSDKHEEALNFYQDEKPKFAPRVSLKRDDSRMALLAKKRTEKRAEAAKEYKLKKEKN